MWEWDLSSQPVRYPEDHINISRLLHGDCRGQSHLQAMWACTSLSPLQPFSESVGFTYSLVSRGNARSSPCLAKAGGKGGFAEPEEGCPAWRAVPTQRCRATPLPQKLAAPQRTLLREKLCLEQSTAQKQQTQGLFKTL